MSPGEDSATNRHLYPALRAALVGLALVGCSASLLAVVRLPVQLLWVPTLVMSSWGFVVGALAAVVAVAVWWRRSLRRSATGRVVIALCLASALISFVPVLRLIASTSELDRDVTAAFGSPDLDHPQIDRASPIVGHQVFGISTETVDRQTFVYSSEGEAELKLDLYRGAATEETPRPLILVVHGGAWQRGSRAEFPTFNRYFASRGYAVAAIDYRLAPAHQFPAPVDDVCTALEFLRSRQAELGIDGERVVLIGRSAGGQIALTAAYRDAGVRGVVGLYAPTDMVWSWEFSTDTTFLDGRAVVSAYLGGTPMEQPEKYRRASPLALARPTSPPTLLIHGGRDVLVSPKQSSRLASRLAELGVAHLHIVIPGGTHAFDVGFSSPMGQVSTFAMERFLAAVMRASR